MASSPGQNLKDHYQDYYTGPNSWREVNAQERAAMITSLYPTVTGSTEKPTVVDIGCGEGAVASALASEEFPSHLVGYDISPSGVSAARQRRIPKATFSPFDGERLPVEDDAFDLAILSHVIEHVEYPRNLLLEANRVARHVYVEVPLELHWRTPKNFVADDLGHINLYTAVSIRHLLQSTGLTVHRQRTYCQSIDVFRHKAGRTRGTLIWAVKRELLELAEPLAVRLFTYHCGLIASH